MLEDNAREYLTAKDLEDHPLWFFDDVEKLIYPVIVKKDFPADPADLWIRADFTTAKGLKLKGYIVGFENISGLAVIYMDYIFWFDNYVENHSLSIKQLSEKMNKQLKPEDFLPLTYEACIDLPWIYKVLTGELGIYKRTTPKKNEIVRNNFDIFTTRVISIIRKILPKKKIKKPARLNMPRENSGDIARKVAVISATMNVEDPQSAVYALYVLDKYRQMEYYKDADDEFLMAFKKRLFYQYELPAQEFNIETMIILPEANSSLRMSPELRLAVRQSINNMYLINAINKYYKVLVFVRKTINAGETLLNAHGPFFLNHLPQDIDLYETPFALPRQAYTTTCPENLVQVEIEFTMKINRGANHIIFCPYFLSLLINTENSTIWDARGKPAERVVT